jgi:hypothetical protein
LIPRDLRPLLFIGLAAVGIRLTCRAALFLLARAVFQFHLSVAFRERSSLIRHASFSVLAVNSSQL